jgi:hypothetical protein
MREKARQKDFSELAGPANFCELRRNLLLIYNIPLREA